MSIVDHGIGREYGGLRYPALATAGKVFIVALGAPGKIAYVDTGPAEAGPSHISVFIPDTEQPTGRWLDLQEDQVYVSVEAALRAAQAQVQSLYLEAERILASQKRTRAELEDRLATLDKEINAQDVVCGGLTEQIKNIGLDVALYRQAVEQASCNGEKPWPPGLVTEAAGDGVELA